MAPAFTLQLRWLLLAVALSLAAAAIAATAELSAEVPAEKWKALRLKGLTRNASLAVRVETSGPIQVILARHDEAQRFPNGLRATFSGSAERSMSFRVTVPMAGTYYVILDNRKGSETRSVRLFIEALPASPPKPPARPRPKPPGENVI